MERKQRFLLGHGEKLTDKIDFHGGFGDSEHVYSLSYQKKRLHEDILEIKDELSNLPEDALASGNAVIQITLHPKYLSRSTFPSELLGKWGLRFLGSKSIKIKPQKGKGSNEADGAPATLLYVAGKKQKIQELDYDLLGAIEGTTISEDIQKIEKISFPKEEDRMAGEFETESSSLEVVLHFDSEKDNDWEEAFEEYAKKNNVNLSMARSYQSRGLLFIPASGKKHNVEGLAKFSFIRTIRPMPKLRTIDQPHLRRAEGFGDVTLPDGKPVDDSYRVAIFDGGLPENYPFSNWVRYIEPPERFGIGAPLPGPQEHGALVTSAFLFGNVTPGKLDAPNAPVDHYRVLGDGLTSSSLYDVLLYLDDILSETNYPIISFSIGPCEVAGDDVTAWTAMLDEHLGDGDCLAGVAVGNDGHKTWPDSRVQVPSDCVNALSVGATDRLDSAWKPAPYSSIGPGRSPGLIKPDVVAFGGYGDTPFNFVSPDMKIVSDCGTSYSTPLAMRLASGLRSYFGSELTPTAMRALIIHSASQGEHPIAQVGWGMISDLATMVTCTDGEVKILFQGELVPGKVIRVPVPLPDTPLQGFVTISATFCYTCNTDPHTPGEYTRAGLDVKFRPHKDKFTNAMQRIKKTGQGKIDPRYPDTDTFFPRSEFKSEADLRTDGHKWDTVRKSTTRKRGSSLNNPVFDIHYIAREPGSNITPSAAEKLSYALIISVESPRTPDLYEKVEAKYSHTLTPIEPRVEIPTQINT